MAMIQLPVSFTQKGFPCLGLPSLGSFNKWQGRFSRRFVIILKGKLQLEISKIDTLLQIGMYPQAEHVCRQIYTQKLPQRWILAHVTSNTYAPKHTQTVCSKHPQCTLGPHLFTLAAGINTQVKLQWNIII